MLCTKTMEFILCTLASLVIHLDYLHPFVKRVDHQIPFVVPYDMRNEEWNAKRLRKVRL